MILCYSLNNMKLRLISLAIGIFITVGIFFTVLFVRALFKDDVSTMFLMWVFWWPVWIMRRVPGISPNVLVWVSLAIATLLNIAVISFATYFVLRAIVSRRKRTQVSTAIPPQPPAF